MRPVDDPGQMTAHQRLGEVAAILARELHNLPLVIAVKCKKRQDTGEVTNEVKGYAKRESAVGQPQQAPVHDQTPPWAR